MVARLKQIQLIDDVDQFDGHIASFLQHPVLELVIPLLDAAGEVFAVMDIDLISLALFDQQERSA